MDRISNRLVLGLAWLMLAAVQVNAQEVSASKGWVQLPSDGETSANAFVAVKNPTMYDVYLVSASTGAAGKVEFRDGESENLREVTVPAYGTMNMKAEGVHLTLVDLEKSLEPGETVALTITTDANVKLRVKAVVQTSPPQD